MSSSTPTTESESASQRQARLRRERRQAKIATGGTDRLNAITGLSGRQMSESEPTPTPPQQALRPTSTADDHPDPDIMEISHQTSFPRRTPQPGRTPPPGMNPFGFPDMSGAGGPSSDDPMMQMLQQMMKGEGGGQLPPGFADMFGGGAPPVGPDGKPMAQAEPAPDSTYIWRIIHAITSLFLAVYVVFSSTMVFTGSKAARTVMVVGDDFGARLFFWFATVEVVLQSSRYFIERGQLRSSGMLGTIAAFIPEPWAGYVRLMGRYRMIFSTLAQDALLVVFVLGAAAWWNGMVES